MITKKEDRTDASTREREKEIGCCEVPSRGFGRFLCDWTRRTDWDERMGGDEKIENETGVREEKKKRGDL